MFRPKLVIDEVLVELPQGKKYLGSETLFPQKRQTGQTCWYYALNPLRTRYGKSFPDTHPGRKQEIIFSDHRKQLFDIYKKKKLYDRIIAAAIFHPINAQHVQEHIKNAALIDQNFFKPDEAELYRDFLLQTRFVSLEGFAKYKIMQEQIALCVRTFQRLGLDPRVAIKNFINVNEIKISSKSLRLSDKLFLYLETLKVIAIAAQTQDSAWHPINDGISGLIKALRARGACLVGGQVGKPFYTGEPKKQRNQFCGHDVYGWDADENVSFPSGHAILIVGAQQIGNKGYVYFVDPNDGHSPSSPPPLYVMPYSRLVKNISNVYGFMLHVDGCKKDVVGPFACHAKPRKTS